MHWCTNHMRYMLSIHTGNTGWQASQKVSRDVFGDEDLLGMEDAHI